MHKLATFVPCARVKAGVYIISSPSVLLQYDANTLYSATLKEVQVDM